MRKWRQKINIPTPFKVLKCDWKVKVVETIYCICVAILETIQRIAKDASLEQANWGNI